MPVDIPIGAYARRSCAGGQTSGVAHLSAGIVTDAWNSETAHHLVEKSGKSCTG